MPVIIKILSYLYSKQKWRMQHNAAAYSAITGYVITLLITKFEGELKNRIWNPIKRVPL